ncbi:Haloacid dehalogenase-like hydrolase domain-containing protein 3 [Mactra antiquata]
MSPIRLVTFDVTNTLIRVLGSVGKNYANVASIYGKTVEPEKLDIAFRAVYKHNIKEFPNFGVHNNLTPFKWWTNVVVETFKAAGSDGKELEQIANHLYIMFSTQTGWEVVPGAINILSLLKQNGVKIGIISNFDDRLEKILAELSLIHYFDFVIASAIVKVAKPEAEIFKMALKKSDVKPEEVIHVGDNVNTDYFGAKDVGLNSVLFLDKDREVPDGVNDSNVIRSLDELPKFTFK